MTTQPEQILEDSLVAQLVGMGYELVPVHDEKSLLQNLKRQIEVHNKISLSDSDFRQILNRLNKGSIFEKAKTLRDRVAYVNDDGDTKTVELIDQIDWCKNEFRVTHQVKVEGRYKNRYDVTILINGLPLVQIELKRRGLELKEAFNQINRLCKELKSQGNIVCFRNLKGSTDEAITLFANKTAAEDILLDPYEESVMQFNDTFAALLKTAPSVNSVTQRTDEEKELAFVKTFRNMSGCLMC